MNSISRMSYGVTRCALINTRHHSLAVSPFWPGALSTLYTQEVELGELSSAMQLLLLGRIGEHDSDTHDACRSRNLFLPEETSFAVMELSLRDGVYLLGAHGAECDEMQGYSHFVCKKRLDLSDFIENGRNLSYRCVFEKWRASGCALKFLNDKEVVQILYGEFPRVGCGLLDLTLAPLVGAGNTTYNEFLGIYRHLLSRSSITGNSFKQMVLHALCLNKKHCELKAPMKDDFETLENSITYAAQASALINELKKINRFIDDINKVFNKVYCTRGRIYFRAHDVGQVSELIRNLVTEYDKTQIERNDLFLGTYDSNLENNDALAIALKKLGQFMLSKEINYITISSIFDLSFKLDNSKKHEFELVEYLDDENASLISMLLMQYFKDNKSGGDTSLPCCIFLSKSPSQILVKNIAEISSKFGFAPIFFDKHGDAFYLHQFDKHYKTKCLLDDEDINNSSTRARLVTEYQLGFQFQ